MSTDEQADSYPSHIALSDGQQVELRLMTADDGEAVLDFARTLPEEDLLFMRVDLTQPEAIEDWISNLRAGRSTSILAYLDGAMIGYATVHREPARWTRRSGEIRVNVDSNFRSKGLGRNLVSHIFDLARGLGLRKLLANMTTDQTDAQRAFRRLGFVPEAVLADYIEDRSGMMRDLVIMSYDVGGLSDGLEAPLRL